MTARPRTRALLAALTSAALALTTGALTATASSAAAPKPSTTSATEAARVDRVKAKPTWFDCSSVAGPRAQCGTITLPLDYDQPKGATTEVAMLRIKVADPKKKIGTLFLNPGGPGGSGVSIAAAAPDFLSPAVLARFDVVGIDPRGTNFSDNVACFKNLGIQATALGPLLTTPFPVGSKERTAYVGAAEKFGKACSTTGKPLSASMSTAEVARDTDVVRRALGDKKLTFLGFSYGTYLGNVYANMFPDRVRAIVIDGVLDPLAWAGRASTASVPQTQRLKSGEGAYRALQEILKRCQKAGPTKCYTAQLGDPELVWAKLVAKVKKKPIELRDDDGVLVFEVSYAMLTSILLGDLYQPFAGELVDSDITWFTELANPSSTAKKAAARAGLLAHLGDRKAAAKAADKKTARLAKAMGFGFPYDNSPEAFQSVLCSDGLNPAKASSWGTATKYAEVSAPGFGPLWSWSSAPCASSTWTAKDEDSYRGSFSHRTSAPVLVVGNYWDPATNYEGAVRAAHLLPSSRLLSSDSWGHTAYGTSACVTGAVDTYLLTGKTPKAGKVCKGDAQPFTQAIDEESGPVAGDQGLRTGTKRTLPPVVAPLPGGLPRY